MGSDSKNNMQNKIKEFQQPYLYRLKSTTLYKTHSGKQGNTDKYRIVTSYRKERFDIEPLNELKILPPKYKNQGGYRVFEECDDGLNNGLNLRI